MSLDGKTIAIALGGPGSEREISLASAKGVHKALASLGLDLIDLDVRGADFEVPEGADLVYNLIHGTFGEDGQIQEILDARGIPYTGAGAASSRMAFDKFLSKERFLESGVPTPRHEVLDLSEREKPEMDFPLVVKPACEGSSVGVHLVRKAAEWDAAIADARKYANTLLIEELIDGKELTVGVLDDVALPIVHIQPRSGFYDIKNKYPWLMHEGGTDYFCPAALEPSVTRAVQEAALAAHRALGVEIYSRVDLLLDASGNPFVLELNTIPGMTESSLLPKAAKAAGMEFGELCVRIAELSLALRRPENVC
jgi:D-alanine-D-alanine ligase